MSSRSSGATGPAKSDDSGAEPTYLLRKPSSRSDAKAAV
jgi:hypothetical protein